MGDVAKRKPKTPPKQHDPTPEERDERVTIEGIDAEEALKRLLEFIDRELSESEHDSVEQHLRICRNCCSRMEFESRLKDRLSALSSDDVPPTTRDRVRELIKRF